MFKDGVPITKCGCLFFKGLGEVNCKHRVSISQSPVQPTVKGWDKSWNTIHLCTECEISVLQKMLVISPGDAVYENRLEELLKIKNDYLAGADDSGNDSPGAKRQKQATPPDEGKDPSNSPAET